MIAPSSALLVVDVQNDFLPGGSLSVPSGDQVIPVINSLITLPFPCGIFFSQDWHPATHISFYTQHPSRKPFELVTLSSGVSQTLWPPHCVQDTHGAQFPPALEFKPKHTLIRKGKDPMFDSYSAFCDNHSQSQTELKALLLEKGVKTLYVCGLALDVCVLHSVLDAVKCGFTTVLLEDACRGLSEQSNADALARMKAAGVIVSSAAQLA